VKTLLSLDLGLTTGYAVILFFPEAPGDLEKDAQLHEHGVLEYGTYRSQLSNLLSRHYISHYVAESPVIIRGQLGTQLQEIITHTKSVLIRQVEFVDPTRWKSTPFKRYPTPKKLTPHERDAIRLGMWYVKQLQGR
jgi:hypothetical protein